MYITIETNWCVTIWIIWNVVERVHKVQMRLNGIHLTNVDLQLVKFSEVGIPLERAKEMVVRRGSVIS